MHFQGEVGSWPTFRESDARLVRAQMMALLPLVDAITDPLVVRRAANAELGVLGVRALTPEVMTKISDTRCYSLSMLERIQQDGDL
jgi:hypothetical protein